MDGNKMTLATSSTALAKFNYHVTTSSSKCQRCRQIKCRCYTMLSLYFAAQGLTQGRTQHPIDLKAFRTLRSELDMIKAPNYTPQFKYNGYNDIEYTPRWIISPYGPVGRLGGDSKCNKHSYKMKK